MAMVSIDIEAMIEYVAALESAIADSRWAAAALQSLCMQAGEWDVDCASFNGGESTAQLEARLMDARQRLALAQIIASTDASLGSVIQFEEQFAEKIPDGFVFHQPDPDLVEALKAKLLAAGSDQGMSDSELERAAIMIATMVANSAEPYKSLFIDNLDDVTFKDISEKDGAKFNSWTNTVHIDVDRMFTDVPAPFHTFFHEFGHAIDDFEGGAFRFESPGFRYTAPDGSTSSLPDLMKSDVYNDIYSRLTAANSGFTSDAAQAQRVAEAITGWSTFYLTGWEYDQFGYQTDTALPGTDARTYLQVKDFYEHGIDNGSVFYSDVTRTASDIYGAVTNHGIDGYYGHHDWHYWLAPGLSGAPEKEFWAGFYADNMTHYWELAEAAAPGLNPARTPDPSILGVTGLDATWVMLPSASQAAANMAEQMAGS